MSTRPSHLKERKETVVRTREARGAEGSLDRCGGWSRAGRPLAFPIPDV